MQGQEPCVRATDHIHGRARRESESRQDVYPRPEVEFVLRELCFPRDLPWRHCCSGDSTDVLLYLLLSVFPREMLDKGGKGKEELPVHKIC